MKELGSSSLGSFIFFASFSIRGHRAFLFILDMVVILVFFLFYIPHNPLSHHHHHHHCHLLAFAFGVYLPSITLLYSIPPSPFFAFHILLLVLIFPLNQEYHVLTLLHLFTPSHSYHFLSSSLPLSPPSPIVSPAHAPSQNASQTKE